ncbi:MAG: hypothetical protein N3A65_10130, partial [candidate division WOR-3 bacterium]|nr:hypothetical protein [candidate division WOR-3 bacterium]
MPRNDGFEDEIATPLASLGARNDKPFFCHYEGQSTEGIPYPFLHLHYEGRSPEVIPFFFNHIQVLLS